MIQMMDKPVDKALAKIGNSSRYQFLLVVLLFFLALQVNHLLIGPTFIFMNPLFACSFSDKQIDEAIACDRIDQCKILYDFTISATSKLYCDKQFERSLIQAISPLGAFFGLIIINYISDSIGRKVALILSLLLSILGILLTLLGGFLNYIWLLVISQFLTGFSGYSLMIMMLIIPAEYCENELRQRILIVISGAWSLSFIIIGLLFKYFNLWYNYLIFIVLIPLFIILIISHLFLVEGPKFLYEKKRFQQCLLSLKTIAVYNKTLAEYQNMKQTFDNKNKDQQNISQFEILKNVLRNKEYKVIILVLISIEIGGNINYSGLNYVLNQFGYDYGTNMIINGGVQIFSYIIMGIFITKMERKKWLQIFYGLIVFVGLLFFINPIKESKQATNIIIGVLRFLGSKMQYILAFGFMILLMFLTQSFPLNVQATCAGFVEAFSQIGWFFAPIIINLCISLQVYPIIVISFIVLILMFLPLLMIKNHNHNKVEKQEKDSLIVSGVQDVQ